MLRFLADESFNGRILRGLLRRIPDLDVVRAQDVEALQDADDPLVLEWAAEQGRVVLTHDISTMGHHAYGRVIDGRPMPGVFEVSADLPVGVAIEELVLIAKASEHGEWEGQVRYLPLRRLAEQTLGKHQRPRRDARADRPGDAQVAVRRSEGEEPGRRAMAGGEPSRRPARVRRLPG